MAKDISFMQYMQAHGNTPGPTQRPLLTGAIAGVLAEIPAGVLLYWSGALESIARSFGISLWLVLGLEIGLMTLAGILYAAIFKRAANDRQGGWLFGAAYGFLLWMLAPITLWQLVTPHPVVVGGAAMGLFGAQVFYGLVLGLIFPRIHQLVQMKLSDVPKNQSYPKLGGEISKTRGN
jgi:hypothetical protein